MIAFVCQEETKDILDVLMEKNNRSIFKVLADEIEEFSKYNSSKLSTYSFIFFDLSAFQTTADRILLGLQSVLIFNKNIVVLALNENPKSVLLSILRKEKNLLVLNALDEGDIVDILNHEYIRKDISVEEMSEHYDEPVSFDDGFIEEEKKRDRLSIFKNAHKKASNWFGKEKIIKTKYEIEEIYLDKQDKKKIVEKSAERTRHNEKINISRKTTNKKQTMKEIIVKEKILMRPKEKIIIAIAGSENKVGTSTQSFQLLNYLQEKKMHACYIEENNQNRLQEFEAFYDDMKMAEDGFTISSPIGDMIALKNSNELVDKNYDCYIKDLSVLSSDNINSFSKAEIKILCFGVKSWEMEQANHAISLILENKLASDTYYFIAFTDMKMQRNIQKMMSAYKHRTFFPHYTPNPFTKNDSNHYIYENILKNHFEYRENTRKDMVVSDEIKEGEEEI